MNYLIIHVINISLSHLTADDADIGVVHDQPHSDLLLLDLREDDLGQPLARDKVDAEVDAPRGALEVRDQPLLRPRRPQNVPELEHLLRAGFVDVEAAVGKDDHLGVVLLLGALAEEEVAAEAGGGRNRS